MKLRPVSRELLDLSFPILLSNWIYALQGFVILLSVSSFGEEVIAGVGFASTLIWLLYGIDEAVYTGIAVQSAFELGRGKRVGRFIFYGLTLSILISLPLYFKGEELLISFLKFFSIKEEVLEAASQYVDPIIDLLPVVLFTNSLNALFNGVGRTKEIFYATAFTFFLNVILLMLFVPKLGPRGAGWAVSLSEAAASLIYLYLAAKEEKLNPFKDLKLKLKEIFEIIRVGLPASVEETVSSFSYNVFTGLIATCGTEALAAFQVGLKIEGVALSVGFSLMDASLPFIGQTASRANLLKERVKELMESSLTLGVLVGSSLLILGPVAVSFFNVGDEVRKWSIIYILIAGLSQPFFTLSSALTGALRALRKTGKEATINIGSFWLIRITPSWLLLKVSNSPLIPWGFMAIETAIRSSLLRRELEKEIIRKL